jgi:membrane-bound serine protease (ClpP class)
MAPGTHAGAAHPVSGTGEKIDDTAAEKAVSDLAAYARSLAEKRGRNVALAEEAVRQSRSFTDQEAAQASPPLIDLTAASLEELLQKLDGRTVTRFDGAVVTLETSGAEVRRVDMTWRQKILSAVAHPQVAYLLFTLGTLGLTIELWNPGAVLPGVVGGLCLLLAFFAFQILPISYAGVALVLFGLLLLLLEIKVTSFGLLAVGGFISLTLGSLMLVDSPLPELQIGWQVIGPTVLALGGIFLFLARLALSSLRRRSVTGAAGLLDEVGEALTPIGPGRPGQVRTHGEIWSATSDVPITSGDTVEIAAVDGLTLRVRHPSARSAHD